MRFKKASTTMGLAAALMAASASPGHAADPLSAQLGILTLGGELYANYVGQDAFLRSELWFFGSVNPGPSQTPGTPPGVFLFANKGSTTSAYNGSTALGSPTPDLNSIASTGAPFLGGTELFFGLFVKDLDNGNGRWFYTGPAGSNPDSRIHASVAEIGTGVVQVGFEDLCKTDPTATVCSTDSDGLLVDWDYNDHMFNVTGATTTPEPASMALLGTGLAGLFGAARRRRNRREELVS